MRLLCLIALLLVPPALADATTAYHADESCPFTRGKHTPQVKEVMDKMNGALEKLSKNCPAVEVEASDIIRAFEKLAEDSGVPELAKAGEKVSGFHGALVDCTSYVAVFRQEFEAAKSAARSGATDFPTNEYKECLSKPSKETCIETAFVKRVREKRHECLALGQNDRVEAYGKKREAFLGVFQKSFQQLAKKTAACPNARASFVDAALSGVSALSIVSPALGPYGAPAAIGIETLRLLLKRSETDIAQDLKDRDSRNETACLYVNSLAVVLDCPRRLGDAQKEAERKRTGPPPLQTKKFIEAIHDASSQIEKLQKVVAAKGDPGKSLSAIKMALSKKIALPAPTQAPAGSFDDGNNTVLGYLRSAGPWLSAYAVAESEDADPEVIRSVRKQGMQLTAFLKAYDSYLTVGKKDPTSKEFDAAREKVVEVLSAKPEDGTPMFDLSEMLSHGYDAYPPEYGFRQVELHSLTNDTKRSSEAAQGDLLLTFTGLVEEMKKNREAFFDVTMLHKAKDAPKDDAVAREALFNTHMLPMLRSCSLLQGLYFYPADVKRRETPLGKLDFNAGKPKYGLPWEEDKSYRTMCAPFFCRDNSLLRSYVMPIDSSKEFQTEQCVMLRRFDEIADRARRRFSTTGDVCKEPPPPKAPVNAVPHRQGAPIAPQPINPANPLLKNPHAIPEPAPIGKSGDFPTKPVRER